ncbi:MAG: hypothetical protein PHD04_03020 [Candidatus Pacebacteria bacterium]|nr:hypothetical protein [Candidatus Paceibacterota bacterium]
MFTSIVNWFKSLRQSEATEQEIEEYFAKQDAERKREHEEAEREYQEYMAYCSARQKEDDQEREKEYLERELRIQEQIDWERRNQE